MNLERLMALVASVEAEELTLEEAKKRVEEEIILDDIRRKRKLMNESAHAGQVLSNRGIDPRTVNRRSKKRR